VLETTRGMEDFEPFMRKVEAAMRVIETGAFMPADPAAPASPCGWCGYRKVCRFMKRPVTAVVPWGPRGVTP
jgi:hypothetical protein